jgi:hypothetical protein
MNNGPLKVMDEPRHIWQPPNGLRTVTPRHKTPLTPGYWTAFVRFRNPKGNRTVAQSYQRHVASDRASCFIPVSPSCRSWGSEPSVRPAVTAAERKIFGHRRSRGCYRRPNGPPANGRGLILAVTTTPKIGVRRTGRPIPITTGSPFRTIRHGRRRIDTDASMAVLTTCVLWVTTAADTNLRSRCVSDRVHPIGGQ